MEIILPPLTRRCVTLARGPVTHPPPLPYLSRQLYTLKYCTSLAYTPTRLETLARTHAAPPSHHPPRARPPGSESAELCELRCEVLAVLGAMSRRMSEVLASIPSVSRCQFCQFCHPDSCLVVMMEAGEIGKAHV